MTPPESADSVDLTHEHLRPSADPNEPPIRTSPMPRAPLMLLSAVALHDAARVAFIGGALALQRQLHPDGFDGRGAALNVTQAIRETLNEDNATASVLG
jgi:hypothetical protein